MSGPFDPPHQDCSHVLHLATETELGVSASASFITAVEGTQRVLDLAAPPRRSRFLLTSSGAVYGSQPPTLSDVDEDHAGAPQPDDSSAGYGHGKRAAEFLCAAAALESGLEVKIARGFAFVGPLLPLDANFAIGNFIHDALTGKPIAWSATGRRVVRTSTQPTLRSGCGRSCSEAAPGAYNVGSEADLSVADLAHLVAHAGWPAGSPSMSPGTAIPGTLSGAICAVDRPSELRAAAPACASISRTAITRTAGWYSAGPMRGRVGQ